MRSFGLLCVAAYCCASWLVAVRLLRLAARTDGAPERLLGSALLAGGAIGYPVAVAAAVLGPDAPELAMRLGITSVFALSFASGALLVAWRVIYHPGAAWSRRVVAVLMALLFFATVDRVAAFDPAALLPSRSSGMPRPLLFSILAGALPYAANAISGLRYHAMLRRRIALGLAEPLVANRILLWSLTSCVVVTQYGYSIASPFMWRWFDPTLLSGAVVGSLGLVIATLLLLAFFPPPAYRRWVEGSGGAAG